MSDRPETVLQTPQFDARFPNVNQTKNCWQNFVDFHRCANARGEDFPVCVQFKKTFTSLCPIEWVDRWTDQVENGVFPTKLD
ncbi:cytochrome c oxidase subunit 6b [Fonticula alba]|uniref:Cytochrome c oxidase subunit n=1 Tax=Fonticula alba TaxID=691883 RepID=A0A058Z4W3_FONAL|nr:cytochrome c oxidase subunit 6b [Fonticula alba]KCV68537.1 cytochrome c oxidase subunit 6b [Fonticula alba]|eukprot:XP_009496969.1 cytochrome c oxidase subunit 6b [Fonticula alba]